MTEQDKHDASLGRVMRYLAIFHGAALLTCLVLVCIFGDKPREHPGWIFYTSLASGAVITFLFWRQHKKEEMSGGCDGSTRVYEALRTGSTPVPDTVTKCQKGLHSLDK